MQRNGEKDKLKNGSSYEQPFYVKKDTNCITSFNKRKNNNNWDNSTRTEPTYKFSTEVEKFYMSSILYLEARFDPVGFVNFSSNQ